VKRGTYSKAYPPKLVISFAYKEALIELGKGNQPLDTGTFSGGEETANKILKKLKFDVLPGGTR